MAVGYVRMWLFAAVVALLMVASFANSDETSGEEAMQITKMATHRKLLGVHLNDYGEPSANKGHDPRGRKGRTPPKKKKKQRTSNSFGLLSKGYHAK